MRFNQICEFLDRENWEYDPKPDEQWLVLQREGLRIEIAVDEDGEFIRFVVPELLRIAGDEPHGQAALQSLLHLGWRSQLARWQRDPADGEVRLQVDLPIEDSELSARQFWRILHETVTLAQQGREQVRQVLATGEAGARDAGEKIRLAAGSGLLSLLLQAQMSGGAESVNRELDRRGGELDPHLADDASHLLEVVAASEGRELQEGLAGEIGNIAICLQNYPRGGREQNLLMAIRLYHLILEAYPRNRAPIQWATIQNNLGTAYSNLPTGDRGENLERAIACYERALTVRTPELFPLECLQTARNWGNLAFKEGDWQQALTQYGRAISAIEGSRRSAVSEERRQQIVAESISVYENAIQAAINLNDFATALEIVERVRAKRLVDLMATADLYADGEIPPQVRDRLQQLDNLDRQIAQCRAEHQQQQQEGKASPSSPEDPEDPVEASPTEPTHPNSGGATTAKQPRGSVLRSRQRAAISAATAEIEQLERQKQAILDELSRIDEVVAKLQQVQPPQLQDFEGLRAEKTALLNFYTTDDHTHILILRPGSDRPECFTCRGQGYRNLQQWLRTTWAIPYLNKKNRWRRHMPETLAELARRLELDRLIEEYLQGIEELVVVPHLFLHQIPFAALPLSGEERYLGDRFRLRYAPSLQVLNFCRRRESLSLPEYGTVENTTDDLLFSSFEGETVCQLFDVDPTRRLIGPQATVTAYRQLLAQTHRLVSSHHAQSRTDNPLESGLRLSDGTITVSQLFAPSWRFPQLEEVYLSCCETGLFVPKSAVDEPVALSTGFLCAGARGVIASQWSIYDFSSALLSSLYHEQRKAGLNRLQALQSAQRHLREMSGQGFEDKYGEPLREFLEAEQNRIADLPNHDPKQLMEMKDAAKLINEFAAGERPFEHPCHWAGLACYGLG
ncbi:CHAT domain-containing protein [Oxynema sp. CENA135]|uniref:CHAT domain-containing protein n=1 Tax=Oxynema sp. CENA135 TaxID=984206 RepID=UPI00190A863F|nr:CHAT domain-containing tetratricopeptide repeat protein [Oxynema sp. CENA135]MBK4732069.1 CHAT domain-containing protein [Oxynema sp. CENA135]